MFGFGLESVKAQSPPQINYHQVSGIKTISIGNWDTTYSFRNTSGLYWLTVRIPTYIDITKNPGFTFDSTKENYYDLINKNILFNDTKIRLTGTSTTMAGYGHAGTFNGKWERLTGKPLLDTTMIYYSPLKRTNNPALSDSPLYQLAGGMATAIMGWNYGRHYWPTKYHHAYSPK